MSILNAQLGHLAHLVGQYHPLLPLGQLFKAKDVLQQIKNCYKLRLSREDIYNAIQHGRNKKNGK